MKAYKWFTKFYDEPNKLGSLYEYFDEETGEEITYTLGHEYTDEQGFYLLKSIEEALQYKEECRKQGYDTFDYGTSVLVEIEIDECIISHNEFDTSVKEYISKYMKLLKVVR